MNLRAAAYTLRQIIASRCAFTASLADLRSRPNAPSPGRSLAEAVGWLCRAQDAVLGGGVSYGFDVRNGWMPPYPETTGYIITTLLRCAHAGSTLGAALDSADLEVRARRMASWLTTVQLDSGALPGATLGAASAPTVFNTGQILEGWIEAYRVQPCETLRRCLVRAAAWLVSVQDDDGCWRKHLSPLTVQTPATYNVRSAAALLKAGQLLNEPAWTAAARKNFDWALTQQDERGWFDHNCLTDHDLPLTHTIGYTLEGLLDAAELAGDERYLAAVHRASEHLKRAVCADGFLSGRLDPAWKPVVSWACLTGSCQFALVWFRLARTLDDPAYTETARRLLSFVQATQKLGPANLPAHPMDGTRGGIKGSHPIWGDYDSFRYPNWAAKFFVDALLESGWASRSPHELPSGNRQPPEASIHRRATEGSQIPRPTESLGAPARGSLMAQPAIFAYTAVLSSTGGGQHAMTLLVRHFQARGHETTVFTRPPHRPDHRYSRMLAEVGIPIHCLPRLSESWWARCATWLLAPLLVLPCLFRRLSGIAAAWLAARSIVATRIARLERRLILRRLTRCLRAETARGRKVILHVWGPAALTPILLHWAEREGVLAVYHEMGEADEKYVETWDLAPTVAAIHKAGAVLCCSASVATTLRRVYGYQGRIETVPFMVADPGPAWDKGRKTGGRLTFGAIGRLVPHKRHTDLLAAVHTLITAGYDIGLVIAGSGPLLGALQEEAARFGIADRVVFTGEFERIEDVMAQFDVFVLTSASESQCMPITESMAYGKPVVVSAFGGMPDFVEEGVTGFLVPVGAVPALVAAMKALADNPALRQRMGEEGRKRYLKRYTPEQIAETVERIYQGLLAERPAAGLRVGYVMECYPTFITNEIHWLRQFGAQVTLFNAFRPKPERDAAKEAFRRESHYFPPGYRGVFAANFLCILSRPGAYFRSLLLVRREKESLRMLLLAAWYARLVHRDGIQHLHGTFGTRTTTLAYVTAQLSGRAYSFTTHAYDIYRPNPSLVWKTNHASFMRTISHFNKRYIEEVYKGVDPTRIRVVYLGVDTKKFSLRPSQDAWRGPVRLIAVGDLIEQKGHIYLIRACRLLRDHGHDLTCQIVGDGVKRPVVERELDRLGMRAHVKLLGWVPYSTVRQHLCESHIFVLPCIDLRGQGEHIDGLPVALMEAMAVGLPVVSTSISGIPELIEDGVSGLLVPEKDEVCLAESLKRLIDDHELRAVLGAGGRQQIEERFDLVSNVKCLAALYCDSCSHDPNEFL